MFLCNSLGIYNYFKRSNRKKLSASPPLGGFCCYCFAVFFQTCSCVFAPFPHLMLYASFFFLMGTY